MKDGSYKRCGCMYEIFEDSIYDIDLAIKVAKERGYKSNLRKGSCRKQSCGSYILLSGVSGAFNAQNCA